MQSFLQNLEWLAKYGFIDIFFGVGVISLFASVLRKVVPNNYDQLHIDAVDGGPCTIPGDPNVQKTVVFRLRNAGQTNLFITKCYFKAGFRPWYFLWLISKRTDAAVHPLAMKITHKNAYELKFTGNNPGFSNYETMIPPGNSGGATTLLPLTKAVDQELLNRRKCGTIHVEYATSGRRGVHVLRV